MTAFDVIEAERVPIKAWTRGVPVEDAALQQLQNVASLPFVFKHVAVMPDVHWGMGATVGSVIATKGAIVPAAVGVDIGCGMVAAQLGLTASELPDNLAGVRSAIEASVPHGRTDNGGPNDRGAWGDPPAEALFLFGEHGNQSLHARLGSIVEKHPRLAKPASRAIKHCGTLGTGNHFIEVCLDEADQVWVMLHSGSRGIGNSIGSHFITKAKEQMARYFIHLPDKDLVLETCRGAAALHGERYEVSVDGDWVRHVRRLDGVLAQGRLLQGERRQLMWGQFRRRYCVAGDHGTDGHRVFEGRELEYERLSGCPRGQGKHRDPGQVLQHSAFSL